MQRLHIFIFVFACGSCSDYRECPPCPGSDTQEKSEADTGKEAKESDAGIEPSAFGGKPKEVTSYELHGRAGFDKVNIFERPDMDSPRLGYLRIGQRKRLGDPKYASDSCPKGWFKLPEGGFVCQGRGMLVGTKPRYLRRAPPEPRLDELDPYRHGFIRKDWTPVYKSIPTLEQFWRPPTSEAEGAGGPDGGVHAGELLVHSAEEADGGVDYYEYTKKHYKNVRALFSRGFWTSVASRMFDDKTKRYYYETVRGDFVPGENVHLVKSPTFKGYEVLGDSPLPAAIVTDRHASFFSLRRGRYRGIGPVERLSVYRVFEIAENRGSKFYKIEGDRWLKSAQTELFELRDPPEGVSDKEKWILVNLSRQTLVAYEGTMPVYATMVSTGLAESEETVTPKGRFRIMFKHVTDDMTGTVGDDEAYSVEDVPWVQYLHLNIALHGSFWHSSYGRPKSHGCINLAPADARRLFEWTDPKMPDGWHGIAANDKNPGTLVIIEGETPK
jgi:hypothetical protein